MRVSFMNNIFDFGGEQATKNFVFECDLAQIIWVMVMVMVNTMIMQIMSSSHVLMIMIMIMAAKLSVQNTGLSFRHGTTANRSG